jgi:hypothetical protein
MNCERRTMKHRSLIDVCTNPPLRGLTEKNREVSMMIAGVLDVTQTENLSNTRLSVTVTLTFTVNGAFLYASSNVTRNKFQLQSQVPS